MSDDRDATEETEARTSQTGSAEDGGSGCALKTLGIIAAIGIAAFAAFIWIGKYTIDSTGRIVRNTVESFRPDEVVQTFTEWRELQVTGTEGNILEVATATSTERFARSTTVQMFGKNLPLGTTASEVSVPATYRYHIDLNGQWFVQTDGSRLNVSAPEIRPSLPVAFDTGGMKTRTKSGWARWDGSENLDELETTITDQLGKRAVDPETIDEVRDEARVAVAKFVRTWLVSEDAWGEGKFDELVVKFADEPTDLEVEPAWQLEDETSETDDGKAIENGDVPL